MSSESRINESSTQNSQLQENQTAPLAASEQVGWNPDPIPQVADSEEQNRFHHFHREWVARTYGVQAISLPPQHFFQDPTYPSYLRNTGLTLLDTQYNNVQHEQQAANLYPNPILLPTNIEIRHHLPTAPICTTSTPIAGPSQLPRPNRAHQFTNRPIPVTPKNRLTNEQKLVDVRHCIAAVEDYRMMGKTEFFAIQREIIKHTERFDYSVEAVMGDILIQAKVR
ncbi:hypothetical protein B9Z19DRAFT_1064390 [Tuber borchii]|uniref:Uncharacterized protein n=1 Tax=Tuber borchii TaxID=42251 RepID=A0A2T6ZUV3_TUBBO|nr:hypothetical protein B9Z19DRAFT_1064390 [Tuber borchii]